MGVRSKERDAARDFVVRALAGGDMTLVLLPDGRLQPKVSSEATVALALPVTEPVVDPDPDEALVAANRTRIAELRAAPVGGNVIGFSDVLADREAKVGLVAISLAALHLVLVAIAQWRVSHGGAPIPLLLPALACPCLL